MDQQWSQYGESPLSSRQARYAPHAQGQQHHTPRDPNLASAVKGDPYLTSAVPSRAQSISLASPAGSHGRGPHNGDGDGDVQMEDVDPYKTRHGGRPGHQRINSAQLIQQEESTASRRYSPMNLSPASPYSATPQQAQQQFAAFTPHMNANNHSPTRSSFQMTPNHGYYSPPGKMT